MTAELERPNSLTAVVAQLVSLGARDPEEVAKRVLGDYDKKWLTTELLEMSTDVVTELARRELSRVRRSYEVQLRAGDSKSSAELKLARAWVPGVGWKVAAKLTVEDLRSRALWYERFAAASNLRAAWCHEVADMMEVEGVKELGRLKANLPVLDDLDSVALTT